MKRFILLLSLLCVTHVAFGQLTVDPGHQNIDVKVKRAFASGSDVNIDLIITGTSTWRQLAFLPNYCEFYDDEGNRYEGGVHGQNFTLLFEWDKHRHGECCINIEKDIPRKVRLTIKDVDPYATTFLLIRLRYFGNNSSVFDCTITIRNLEIQR